MVHDSRKTKPDPKLVYADIIDHPHWQSPSRPHMSLYDRAAQFSPFAALTGYGDMISEEARLVDARKELEEGALERLNQRLHLIDEMLGNGIMPTVTIICFVPDPQKSGGRYETRTERIRRIDAARGKVVLTRTEGYGSRYAEIDIKEILDIPEISADR